MGDEHRDCQKWLRAQGESYPRTCQRCGLGPCAYYPEPPRENETIASLKDEIARLTKHIAIMHDVADQRDQIIMERQDEIARLTAALAEATGDGWKNDPSADERWNAGCDFAIAQLAAVLGIDPNAFSWDAATEELEGDVRSVIGNALEAGLGEDWQDRASALAEAEAERDRLRADLDAMDMKR